MRTCKSPIVWVKGTGAVLPGEAGGILRSKWKPRSKRVASIGSITGGEEGFWSAEATAKRCVGIWASRETCISNVDPMASGLAGAVG